MFATGDFVRAEITPGPFRDTIGSPVLVMGFSLSKASDGMHDVVGLVCGPEGNLGAVPATDLSVDYIYDVEKDMFVDRSAKERAIRETDDTPMLD